MFFIALHEYPAYSFQYLSVEGMRQMQRSTQFNVRFYPYYPSKAEIEKIEQQISQPIYQALSNKRDLQKLIPGRIMNQKIAEWEMYTAIDRYINKSIELFVHFVTE